MSPRTREQNEEIRNQRRSEILRAALDVYAERGYAASEIGEVAERAGLARGLVYHYFKSKQALFRELYADMMERSRLNTEAHFKQEREPIELLADYAKWVCRQEFDKPVVTQFFRRIVHDLPYLYDESELPAPFEWVKRFIAPMKETIERGMQDGSVRQGNAELMAAQFWGAISQGMAFLSQTSPDGTVPEASESDREAALNQVAASSLALLKPI